jgi:hypothetical protein
MKYSRMLTGAALSTPLVISGANFGAYTGLTIGLYDVVIANGKARSVWRVYANFTDPDDLVFNWGGPTNDPVMIETQNASGTGLGSNFFNPGGTASNTAPTLEQINGSDKTPAIPNIRWGTFATIGVAIADQGSGPSPDFPNIDQTSLSPGFPNFIQGNQIAFPGACFAVPQPLPDTQGAAGYPADGDPQLRVLLMQLTSSFGENVKGEIDVAVQIDGSGQTVNQEDQVFYLLTPPQFCIADVVAPAGQVNVDDLLAVINGWGSCPGGPCPADVAPAYHPDGVVNVDDLLMVIADWGPCWVQ